MKMTITNQDVPTLTGKFIIQIDSHTPDYTISESNWEFVKEKRLSFVCGLKLIGFYYTHREFESDDEFLFYFNHYVETKKDARFHRLLTNVELDFVCNKLKESNY